MKNFNPDKELNKIKYGKRNTVIFTMIFSIVLVTIGYSFALYQVRHTKRIIYTTVDDFKSNKDIILTVLIDGKEDNKFPEKNTGHVYLKTECDNKSKAYFDTNKWSLYLEAKGQDKCNVYFVSNNSTPNVPELYQGLIPVTIDADGTMKVADTTTAWYNYEEHEWANAVLVDASNTSINNKYFYEGKLRDTIAGTEVLMSEVLQMYVWIPRYKYQLWNAKNESKPEQMINIIFENGIESTGDVKCSISEIGHEICENDENGNWYTHPAFTFGGKELTGFWVGKFESSGGVGNITIKPSISALRNTTLGAMFNAARNIDLTYSAKYNLDSSAIDTHMMKNMEWGAVAYLTQSKYGRYQNETTCVESGCQVWMNNTAYITGCSAKPSGTEGTPFLETTVSSCDETTYWNGEYGRHASTTDNITGVYDMNGGTWEYVMGNMVNSNNAFYPAKSTLSKPDAKYYDVYEYSTASTAHEKGHLGDGIREPLKNFGDAQDRGGWYDDYSELFYSEGPWASRGGRYTTESGAGIFAFARTGGIAYPDSAFRSVLTSSSD